MPTRKIHKRGLTSFFTLFGFVIMSVTGLVLYIVPAGRIAYWVDWKFLALTKTDWDNIHILSSVLFIVAGSFHTYFNWKPLMNYFKDRITHGIKLRRELAISSAVSIIVIASALYHIPPLNYLLDLNEYIKEAWIVQDDYEPPFGHAELLSLKVFTKKMDINLAKAAAELKENGIRFENVDQSLEDIARENAISPMDLYMIIKKFEKRDESDQAKIYTPEMVELEFSGAGIGNRNLSAICKMTGIELSIALERLNVRGVTAEKDQTLKKIAENHNLNPVDIMKIMLVADN